MGKGIDLARPHAPAHAALLDELKDQLLIAFLRRLVDPTLATLLPNEVNEFRIPCDEIDATGQFTLAFSVDFETRIFTFSLGKKS